MEELERYARLVGRLRDLQKEAYAAKRGGRSAALVAELVRQAEALAVEVDAMTAGIIAASAPTFEPGEPGWMKEHRARLAALEGWHAWREWLMGAGRALVESRRGRPVDAVVFGRFAVACRRKQLAELAAMAAGAGPWAELAEVASAALRDERLIAHARASAWIEARQQRTNEEKTH